jgi:hypothetical protein
VVNDRISFSISWAEPWRKWCQLQMSYCDGHYGGYFCSEAAKFKPLDANNTTCQVWDSRNQDLGTLSCAQAYLCRSSMAADNTACACDATGCDASQRADLAIEFFVAGDSAVGVTGPSTIQLTRN